MLIVVAIETQQFPVAAVGWIVAVVVILMMDGQLAQLLAGKFAPAARADPREELQGPLAISLFEFCSGIPRPHSHPPISGSRASRKKR